MKNTIVNHIKIIEKSFDMTTHFGLEFMTQYTYLPKKILTHPQFNKLFSSQFNSGCNDIKKFINPQKNKKFLDLGCYANLFFYKLNKWPSLYFGVDISKEIIKEMEDLVHSRKIKIGGLFNCSIEQIPFEDNYFHYAACINVFEYYKLDFIKVTLKEIHRVLDKNAKFVVDIPNIDHPSCKLMFEIEKYLERPNKFNYPKEKFENLLKKYFEIIRLDSKQVMVKYFLKKIG